MPDFTNYHETDNWIKLHKDLCPATEDKDYCYKNGNIYSIGEFVSFRQVLKSYCEEIRKVLCSRTGADCKRELALFLYRYFLREMKYTSEEALKRLSCFPRVRSTRKRFGLSSLWKIWICLIFKIRQPTRRLKTMCWSIAD